MGISRDRVADALRLKAAELRGADLDSLLPFEQLTDPELRRWRLMAEAALAIVDEGPGAE